MFATDTQLFANGDVFFLWNSTKFHIFDIAMFCAKSVIVNLDHKIG